MTEEFITCELSNFTPEVEIKLINDVSILPTYATKGSAGVDLVSRSTLPITIPPRCSWRIPTGVCISVPEGYEAQVRPRSGLAATYKVTVLNSPGTIDSDYRGEIHVLLFNHGAESFVVNKGDRVAQLVLCPIAKFNFKVVDELNKTDRGVSGFGSTGVKSEPKVANCEQDRLPQWSDMFDHLAQYMVIGDPKRGKEIYSFLDASLDSLEPSQAEFIRCKLVQFTNRERFRNKSIQELWDRCRDFESIVDLVLDVWFRHLDGYCAFKAEAHPEDEVVYDLLMARASIAGGRAPTANRDEAIEAFLVDKKKEPYYKTLMDRVNESCSKNLKPKGLQYDEGKLERYDLIDPDFLKALAELLGKGAVKYAPDNWKEGLGFRRCYASAMRHLQSWFRGERHCPDNGQHHLIAVTARCMFLYKLEMSGRTDCDDRPKD